MDDLRMTGILLTAIIAIVVAAVTWNSQKQELGKIKCKRCGHVGPAKGVFIICRGVKPVCAECQSEDWVKVKQRD